MTGRAAAIGIGSNLADRHSQVDGAFSLLAATPGVVWLRAGPRVDTTPVLPTGTASDHPRYLNSVAILATTLGVRSLLARLLAIEVVLGRRRRRPCDPRTLDLDLLIFEGERVQAPGIEVPHPRLAGRGFVLEPMASLLDRSERDSDPSIRRVATVLRAALPPTGTPENAV